VTRKEETQATPIDINAINKALTLMFVSDLQPFSMIEDVGFHNLMSLVAPSYHFPKRSYFSTVAIPNLYNNVKQQVQQEILQAHHFSITTDAWSSRATQSYLTVTFHFIDSDWILKKFVLETRLFNGSHTGEAIRIRLGTCLQNWGLSPSRLVAAVTDNAANMLLAIRGLRWVHVPCAAHSLQLSLRPVWEHFPPILEMLEKFRTVVTYYHTSCLAAHQLQ